MKGLRVKRWKLSIRGWNMHSFSWIHFLDIDQHV